MASPVQQKSLQRKVIYIGLILALFTISYFFRTFYAQKSQESLALREADRGEVDLTGSFLRHGLIGLRGVAVCGLWWQAIESQKKNQWSELDLLVRSLTKLQPHFITPWLFQGWNLSYNVSVESDLPRDKYFYVARGLDLLCEGERRNTHQPDLRFSIGFTYQHKICQSDETNTMRCLFQMSCIPPSERDPKRFRKPGGGPRDIDWERFEEFCVKHPQLVRRLRGDVTVRPEDRKRMLRYETAAEVIDFLADNGGVPSLYDEAPPAPGDERETPLKPPEQRFPALPPRRNPLPPQRLFDAGEMTQDDVDRLRHDNQHPADAYGVARAWFGYAQEPLPDPSDVPGMSKPITNRVLQRMPSRLTVLLFRNYPARSQSYVGERLELEGWYDAEPWEIQGWFEESGGGKRVRVGGGQNWAVEAWSKAHDMWSRHGRDNGLLFRSPEEEAATRRVADEFVRLSGVPAGTNPDFLKAEHSVGPLAEQFRAYEFVWNSNFYRNLSNFEHFLMRSRIEALEETVKARKAFFEAEQLRMAARRGEALEKYESPEALEAWKRLLLKHPQFRRDELVQEQTYEFQMNYLQLCESDPLYSRQFKHHLALQAFLSQAASRPVGAPEWLPLAHLGRASALPTPQIVGPFDSPELPPAVRFGSLWAALGNHSGFWAPWPSLYLADYRPLLDPDVVDRVRMRMGLKPLREQPPEPGAEGPAAGPGSPMRPPPAPPK